MRLQCLEPKQAECVSWSMDFCVLILPTPTYFIASPCAISLTYASVDTHTDTHARAMRVRIETDLYTLWDMAPAVRTKDKQVLRRHSWEVWVRTSLGAPWLWLCAILSKTNLSKYVGARYYFSLTFSRVQRFITSRDTSLPRTWTTKNITSVNREKITQILNHSYLLMSHISLKGHFGFNRAD